MPQFDESFLSDCALAERWRFYSYNVQQLEEEPHQHHQQQQQLLPSQQHRSLWSLRDNNNNNNDDNNNSNNTKHTLHDIKFHRRRKYKKLPRLALSATSATATTSATTTPICTPLTPPTTPSTCALLVKNLSRYGSISSPSTPSNCSAGGGGVVGGCSSSSNNSINSSIYTSSSSTPPPPQQQQQQQLNTTTAAAAAGTTTPTAPRGGGVPPAPPSAGSTGSSGHKNSLKGTKLARRARSFKDDLIEKISLMRTTNNTLGRSHSPHSPRNKHGSQKPPPTTEEVQRSTQTLETHVKDISNALKHFRDVILKKKLEVLPGNGTVILETIASMYSVIQSYTLNENNAIMNSATQQVYQSLGKLIKLCDEVMLSEKSGECASLSNENVREVIDLLEDAVRNLVTLAQGKLKEQDQCAFRYSGAGLGGIGAAADIMGAVAVATAASSAGAGVGGGGGMRHPAPTDVAAQRTSLPDIALTPKERDILEQSNVNPMRGSHSIESILRDTSPPPKPPLPNRASNPPPLPPKRRSQPQSQLMQATNQQPPTSGSNNIAYANANNSHSSQANSPLPYAQSHNISINSDLDCSSNISLLNYGVDLLSVRSRSPDENSQCSFDSALNHSLDVEEQLHLPKPPTRQQLHHQQQHLEDDVDKMMNYNQSPTILNIDHATILRSAETQAEAVAASVVAASLEAATSSVHATPPPLPSATVATGGSEANTELRKAAAALTSNRHSNESGFVSMMSFRTSTQSVSKRSSEHSVQSSSTKSSSSNSEILFGMSETTASTTTSSTSTTSRSNNSSEYQQLSQTQSSSTQRHITTNSNGGSSSCSSTTASATIISNSSNNSEQLTTATAATTTLSTNLHPRGSNCSSPELLAPALPPKTQQRINATPRIDAAMDELDDNFELPELRILSPHHHQHHSSSSQLHQWQSKHHSLMEPPRSAHLPSSSSSAFDQHLEKPPPLPMKKKHMFQSVAFSVLAYVECVYSLEHRHTMHTTYNIARNISHSQTMNIMPMSKDMSPELETPPALPPKNYKQRKASTTSSSSASASASTTVPTAIITTPPASPKPMLGDVGLRGSRMTTVSEELNDVQGASEDAAGGAPATLDSNENTFYCHSHQLPSETREESTMLVPINTPQMLEAGGEDVTGGAEQQQTESRQQLPCELELDEEDEEEEEEEDVDNQLPNMLEEIDITPYLILKKNEEDGPEVKGGYIDALIVHASRVQKVADNAFSEAFITTFRTFIQPIDVIEKLTHRYTYFFCQVHDQKQKAAKETFSLLVRVVNDLTSTDLTSQLLSLLVEFVYQLVCSGQLYLAKLLRNKFVEKVTLYKDQRSIHYALERDQLGGIMGSGGVCSGGNQLSLLDLKSLEIAEQMTLLDAELFQKIEIPEVLLFAKDQCEEKSPNLNKFTEHFNKMSYWARSKILRLQDAKEREKHVNKFIKIMKHLRKMNNYNSYLALLSALDSGPIRRLEWQKGIAEELCSFCALIDSSSSFRAYRQALAETNPPCIPYIGLVLQDLTFVHVGNQDYVSKGVINFSKRWQQYNIIVNMKRFKKCAYPFRRNERIIRFFDNFKDFMGEEEMWQISERIKPRGRRLVNNY
ncbi:guanine nucleotide-releasing factor 2 isoform X1 [Drosophila albomicans]|uniref:CRK SH3-binding GNRP n=1 Tax=Drosophila albomicans TaxID=7291 RepID=A0A6P8WUP5_DROAB|nr:guanine nucleotide-releasing factor 2 isoform X1 [Drosophila albomicans]